jgi:SET domain
MSSRDAHDPYNNNTFSDLGGRRSLLVLKASRFNHACLPNCDFRFLAHEVIEVRAARPIIEGEELTLTYIDPLMDPVECLS